MSVSHKDDFFTIEKLRELVAFYQHGKKASFIPENDPPEVKLEYRSVSEGILVMECGVAGTGHIPEIVSRLTDVHPGSPVFFSREYFNNYDDLAISISNAYGEKIGYVPRKKNEVIARLMDAGKSFRGEVADIWYPESDNWVNIIIQIYMSEKE